MAVPTTKPLPTPPNRTSGAGVFAPQADIFYGAMPQFQTDMNTVAAFTEAQRTAAEAAKVAAEAAKTAAANSATTAGQQVGLAAAQVSLAKDEVSKATSQAVRSEAGATQSEYWAAIAQEGSGVPSIQGKGGMFLQVQPSEQGVRWTPDTHRIGDILISARGSVDGYIEAAGGIYLQSAYAELYAELGLLGRESGRLWSSLSAAVPSGNVLTDVAAGLGGVCIASYRASNNSNSGGLLKSVDGGSTWQAVAGITTPVSKVVTNKKGRWAIIVDYFNATSGTTSEVRSALSTDNAVSWGVYSTWAFQTYNHLVGRVVAHMTAGGVLLLWGVTRNSLGSVSYSSAFIWRQGLDGAITSTVALPNTGSYGSVTAITSNDQGHCLIATDGASSLWAESPNSGVSWSLISGQVTLPPGVKSAACDGADKWLITGAGYCIRSLDNRTSWQIFSSASTGGAGPLATDREGTWLIGVSPADIRRSVDDGFTWEFSASAPISGVSAALAFGDGFFLFGSSTGLAKSAYSYPYDTATQFRLPNVPTPDGLKAFIKAKEISA